MSTSVTFKCKQTGNTVTFRDAHDIDGMRKHPDYEEVVERVVLPVVEQVLSEPEQPAERNILEQSSAVKRVGRPSKKD